MAFQNSTRALNFARTQYLPTPQSVNILKQALVVPGFGHQQKREPMCAQMLYRGSVGVQTIGDDDHPQLRMLRRYPLDCPPPGGDLTILLAASIPFTDELRGQGHHLALIRMRRRRLHDPVIVLPLLVGSVPLQA